jgi:hypothetical protein
MEPPTSYLHEAEDAAAHRAKAVRAGWRFGYAGVFAYLAFGLASLFTAAIVLGLIP